MKKNILFILLFGFTSIFGQSIDIETAKKIALNAFKKQYQNGYYVKNELKEVDTDNLSIKNSFVRKYNGHNSYYVINFENGGWMILSSHKSVVPVIANSPTGNLNETDMLPQLFTNWMQAYDKRIDEAYQNKFSNKENIYKWAEIENYKYQKVGSLKSYTTTTTSGAEGTYLLSTEWNESGVSNDNQYSNLDPGDAANNWLSIAAYNILLPNKSCKWNPTKDGIIIELPLTEGKVAPGKGATAIAQILKYWGFAKGFNADFNWWDMSNNLCYYTKYPIINPNFAKGAMTISYLLKTCGDANHLNTKYDCFNSITYDNASYYLDNTNNKVYTSNIYTQTLQKFGYKNTMTIYHQLQSNTTSITESINSELDAKRPVLLIDPASNEAFICDGKATDGSFHFNFGIFRSNLFFNITDFKQSGHVIVPTTDLIWITGIEPNWQQSTTVTIPATTIGIAPLTPNETWQASSIVAGSKTSTPFVIPSGNSGRFVAAQSITLLPGFKALQGSNFLAKIYINETGDLKNNLETMNEPNENNSNDSSNSETISFSIMPNPITNGVLTLSTSKEITEKVSIEVFNVIGQKVISFTENSLKEKQIHFENQPKGIYLIKILSSNVNETFKVLHQ